jgi:hypothetical protein
VNQDHHNRQEHKRNNRIAFARTQVSDAAHRTVKRYYQYGKGIIRVTLAPFRFWWNLPDDRKNVIFTGVIAAATTGYFIFASLQWQTMERQWQTMEQQLEAAQRPRFSADASPIELGNTATEPIETTAGIVPLGGPQRRIIFTESNIGTGAAYRIKALTFWQEVPPDMVVVDLNVIHGKGTQLSACTPPTAKVSDKLTCVAFVPVAAFEGVNPNSSLLFYGWIDYCDSLDIPRRDPICWRFYSWKAGGMQSECGSEVVNIPSPDEPCNTHR